MGRDRIKGFAAAAFSVFIFALALYVLNRALGQFDADDVLAAARAYSGATLAGALLLCLASYGALSGFDWLGMLHVGRRLPTGWVMLISFVSHSISHNAGFAVLTGGSVRYRMYSVFGLGMGEVAGIIAFAGLSFGLGAAAIAALSFILQGAMVAPLLRLPPAVLTVLGWAIAGVLVMYLAWAAAARRPLAIGTWRLASPSVGLGIGQILVAATDLALVAAALYLLLPIREAGLAFPAFIGIYVVATLAGTVSHVPGGLGVFEGTLILLLPSLPPQEVLAAMLVFRLFYNLLPLLLGASTLAVFELLHRRRGEPPPPWIRGLGPPLAAMLVFAAGTVLLFTGAVPSATPMPRWLAEPAHLLAGAAGALLTALAWGLMTRSRWAYSMALAAIGAGALLALGRGPDWGAAAFQALSAALLASANPLFGRPGRPPRPPLAWVGGSAAVVAAALWLTWHDESGVAGLPLFVLADEGARAMRANLVALVALAAAGMTSRSSWGRAAEPPP